MAAKRDKTLWVLIGLLGLALVVSSCATTRAPRQAPEEHGFLGDYSQLQKGEGDEASLIYFAPDADFAQYHSLIIDSVTVWRSDQTEDLSDEERQALTDYMYAALHRELSKDYKIVHSPGPGVMQLRVALTEAKGARVVSNTVTSVVPQLRAVSTLGGMAADKAVMVGTTAIEAQIDDSLTDRRLAAAVDERWGTKALRGGIKTWSDAKNAFDFWAKRLRKRLAKESGRDI